MPVLLTGASGFLGSALTPVLTANGHRLLRLVRSPDATHSSSIFWDPARGVAEPQQLEGLDAVVHLAGENIVGRWTPEKKARIRDSRVQGTRTLCESLARLAQPPKVFVSASATGYYGDRGDELLQETSAPGSNFLAKVCQEWEAAAEPMKRRGVRTAHLRFGIILSPHGGALAKMLLPFRLGLGGPIGNGQQYWSWIALDDVVGAIQHALSADAVQGPVNVVSPHPVTNQEFTRVLGHALHRPAVLPMPAFAARLALGEMADELLLASARVEPARLLATHYPFRHPDLDLALRHALHLGA